MREEITAVSSKLKRLRGVYIDEDIEREEYLAEKAELLSRKKSLEEKTADLQKGTIAWLEPLRDWIKDAEMLGEIVESADLPLKKSSAQKIFGSNLSLRDSVIQFTPITPYDALRASRENFSEKDESLVLVPSAGIEPAPPPSEGGIVSVQLQGLWRRWLPFIGRNGIYDRLFPQER